MNYDAISFDALTELAFAIWLTAGYDTCVLDWDDDEDGYPPSRAQWARDPMGHTPLRVLFMQQHEDSDIWF